MSFELQNDRLHVFDIDARKRTSDLFAPEVLIEAYPVVDSAWFRSLPGASNYVLIDPAAGLNHFRILGDLFGAEPGATQFSLDLSFLTGFHRIAEGITYRHVFTGYTSDSLADPYANTPPLQPNAFQVSGTLRITLRRYTEGEDFSELSLPPQEHYFRGEPRAVPNTGSVEQKAVHWNIHPGMKPITWLITRKLVELNAQPEYQDYDLVRAVERGVESWNQAFGFPVFEAEVADSDEHLTADDKSFILFDPNIGTGYAFAQFRDNPNTGEIRGASVYLSAVFFDPGQFGPSQLEGDAAEPADAARALARPRVPSLAWGRFRGTPLCALWAPEYRARAGLADDGPEGTDGTDQKALERFITHVVAHEVGHTLGLRHNFQGSLVPPSSSVMDYLPNEESVALAEPGSYDIAAVRYLHGLDTSLPTEPFCTDEDTLFDPTCRTFDRGADPLHDSAIPDYEFAVAYVLALGLEPVQLAFDYYSEAVRGFVRAGEPAQALAAWDALIAPVRVPLAPDQRRDPALAATVDALTRHLFTLLYLEPGPFDAITAAPSDPAVVAQIVAELRGNLLDLDGVRSFETRRLCVDILERMQSVEAYAVLLEAHAALSAELDRGAATERILVRDLLARVDRAIDPYFD